LRIYIQVSCEPDGCDVILNLTDLSPEPLQSQIVRQIRAMVLSGVLPQGAALPSIRALAREQRVSVITVQRAYESLVREGLISPRRGKGFFVSQINEGRKKEMAVTRLHESLIPIIAEALSAGLATEEIRQAVKEILDGEHKEGKDD